MENIEKANLIANTRHIIDTLELASKLMKDGHIKFVDYSDSYQIIKNSYSIDKLIDDMQKGISKFKLQMSCEHKNTTGMIYVGHDSHHKYYKDSCKECGLTMDSYEE